MLVLFAALAAALVRVARAVVWPIEYIFRLLIAPDTLVRDEDDRYGAIFDASPRPVPVFAPPDAGEDAAAAIAAAVDRHVDRVLVLADHHEWDGVDAALVSLVRYISAARGWLESGERGDEASDAADAAAARLDALEGYLAGMRPVCDEDEDGQSEKARARRRRDAQSVSAGMSMPRPSSPPATMLTLRVPPAGEALTPGVMRKVIDRLNASMRAEGGKRARQGWGGAAGNDIAAMVASVEAERSAVARAEKEEEEEEGDEEDEEDGEDEDEEDEEEEEVEEEVANVVGMRQRRRRRPATSVFA